MKKITSLLFAFCLLFRLVQAQISVFVNNTPLVLEEAPILENGHTLVPMRRIMEALGATVSWDDAAKTAAASRDGSTICVTIGSLYAMAGQQSVRLDIAPKIMDDRTWIPLRFIAESLGCDVKWQAKTETVWITDGQNCFQRPLSVHFLDVGQADSILILLPDGTDMLVDAGKNSDGQKIVSYLKAQGVTDIEYAIGTHPHADHIGGLDTVLYALQTDVLYMPHRAVSTQTYRDVLAAAESGGTPILDAKSGITLLDKNGLKIEMLAPVDSTVKNINNTSAVIRLTYLNNTFLLMGDAETESENMLVGDIAADVLKVGHHGSATSTNLSFLMRVAPVYAVISVGRNNSYKHPSPATLQRLSDFGVAVYRTDTEGTIVFTSDGDTLTCRTAA